MPVPSEYYFGRIFYLYLAAACLDTNKFDNCKGNERGFGDSLPLHFSSDYALVIFGVLYGFYGHLDSWLLFLCQRHSNGRDNSARRKTSRQFAISRPTERTVQRLPGKKHHFQRVHVFFHKRFQAPASPLNGSGKNETQKAVQSTRKGENKPRWVEFPRMTSLHTHTTTLTCRHFLSLELPSLRRHSTSWETRKGPQFSGKPAGPAFPLGKPEENSSTGTPRPRKRRRREDGRRRKINEIQIHSLIYEGERRIYTRYKFGKECHAVFVLNPRMARLM